LFLERVLTNLRSQNWLGLCLELLVVVVGIFLAFQVDRWYGDAVAARGTISHLTGLVEDVSGTRVELERAVRIYERTNRAAESLLSVNDAQETEMTLDEFYGHVGALTSISAVTVVRRTYDSLVSTGEIESVANTELGAKLAAFYSRLSGYPARYDREIEVLHGTLEPYFTRNLDHSAMFLTIHPAASKSVGAFLPPDHYRRVLGSAEFAGVVTTKWHMTYDWMVITRSQIERALEIEGQIVAVLGDRIYEKGEVQLRSPEEEFIGQEE
jgi:hypothetical protein